VNMKKWGISREISRSGRSRMDRRDQNERNSPTVLVVKNAVHVKHWILIVDANMMTYQNGTVSLILHGIAFVVESLNCSILDCNWRMEREDDILIPQHNSMEWMWNRIKDYCLEPSRAAKYHHCLQNRIIERGSRYEKKFDIVLKICMHGDEIWRNIHHSDIFWWAHVHCHFLFTNDGGL
jgi:hypothetical protein